MILSEAANKVLSFLEQTEQEEYTFALAIEHLHQAMHEFAEENEFKFLNEVSEYELVTPEAGTEPAYWTRLPGRAPLVNVLGATWGTFSYIKRAWISVDNLKYDLVERQLSELMDNYGDSEGVPEAFAIEGEYFVWRPIAPEGTDYTIRIQWQKMPADASETEEPVLLAQMPYAIVYRACQIGSLWLLDDNRVPIFKSLSDEAFGRYNFRHSMTGDGPRSMEDFDG